MLIAIFAALDGRRFAANAFAVHFCFLSWIIHYSPVNLRYGTKMRFRLQTAQRNHTWGKTLASAITAIPDFSRSIFVCSCRYYFSVYYLSVDANSITAQPWRVQEAKRRKIDEAVQHALGERVRRLREKRGWSQEEFAARSGLHRTWVGSIERAERGTTLLTLLMIAKCFDMTVAELLRGLEKRIEDLRKRPVK
jgi:DNA-binding XRE family transcriptional regulator